MEDNNRNTISDQVLIEAMHSIERVILALIDKLLGPKASQE